jgi:hypothetical protein
MKKLLTIIWGLFTLLASAQQNSEHTYLYADKVADFILNNGKISATSAEYAGNYLKATLANLKPDHVSLKPIAAVGGSNTFHYTFIQTINGTPVYNAIVKINLSLAGDILSVFDNSISLNTANSNFPEPSLAENFITKEIISSKVEQVFFPSESGLIAAIMIQLGDKESYAHEYIIDSNGGILFARDLNVYFSSGKDSLVKAGVFLPNPIISAGVSYGYPYLDSNDEDIAELNAEIKEVEMLVTFVSDTFFLESPYVKITEHSSPSTTPAFSTIPEFNFTRSKTEFEDVNVYYHLNFYQHYIRSLGFENLASYQINVDAHAHNGADQSSFSPFFTPHRLNFGTGGVDDGEDAHVVIHEYAHAISESAAPSTNSGNERQALDEGLADYFAVSYSKSLNPHDWQKVFSWDGHNPFWTGRSAAVNKKYPQDLTFSIHANGEIWSSTLMQIQKEIGREVADRLMLQSLYSYSANMTMSAAAQLLIQADELLYNGVHRNTLCYFLNERGLFNCFVNVEKQAKHQFKIINSNAFASGKGNATITFPENSDYILSVFEFNGKTIQKIKINNSSFYELSPQNLESGMYLFIIENTQTSYRFKLVKY